MKGRGMTMTVFPTLLGWSGVAVTGKGIMKIVLPRKNRRQAEQDLRKGTRGAANREQAGEGNARLLSRAVAQLRHYLSGKTTSFALPVDVSAYTVFRQAVWRAAAEIPYGETRPYAWIARRINKPKATRAVGQALGMNPVPLLIP